MSAPASTVQHSLLCLLQPAKIAARCQGECNPPPRFDRVQLRRVTYFDVPVPEDLQDSPAAAVAYAEDLFARLPVHDQEQFAVVTPSDSDTWTPLETR